MTVCAWVKVTRLCRAYFKSCPFPHPLLFFWASEFPIYEVSNCPNSETCGPHSCQLLFTLLQATQNLSLASKNFAEILLRRQHLKHEFVNPFRLKSEAPGREGTVSRSQRKKPKASKDDGALFLTHVQFISKMIPHCATMYKYPSKLFYLFWHRKSSQFLVKHEDIKKMFKAHYTCVLCAHTLGRPIWYPAWRVSEWVWFSEWAHTSMT